MSDKINPAIASAVSDAIAERKEQRQMRCANPKCGNEYPVGVIGPQVCAECGEAMHTHIIEEERKPVEGVDDVLVSLGDLSTTQLSDITFGPNYEKICLDYVTTFNMAITQGINPVKALMAMCQATAIVMGQCIQAGLRLGVAQGMVKYIIGAAQAANNKVNIITKPN